MSTEHDPNGIAQHAPGAKLDAAKVPVMRGAVYQFPRALTEVARLSQFGADKYSWNGWESVPDGIQRYRDARGRHEFAQAMGETHDPDSRVLHLTAVAWNALAELELTLRQEAHQ